MGRTCMDEYGFTVHEDCFHRLTAEESSAQVAKKKPPGTENKS
jgi:hypothetical protein